VVVDPLKEEDAVRVRERGRERFCKNECERVTQRERGRGQTWGRRTRKLI